MFIPYANYKGAVQPAHPRSLISVVVFRYLDSIRHIVAISEILDSICSRAGRFESYLVATPEGKFSRDVARISPDPDPEILLAVKLYFRVRNAGYRKHFQRVDTD